MEQNEFNEIIDYAIDKENEAILFYEELKLNEKMPHIIKVLDDIINMEKGHINRIELLRTTGPVDLINKQLKPLNLSDYYEEPVTYENLDYIALLQIAMKREDQAKKLYQDLANYSTDIKIREVFLLLSEEESKHKELFEEIYQEYVLIDN